ncbi:MAG: hypothetical protein GY862_35000 [Gammaproteobacteria bacterium]|nr:hypothetical protein [Gammaproteobacteria bacterium]
MLIPYYDKCLGKTWQVFLAYIKDLPGWFRYNFTKNSGKMALRNNKFFEEIFMKMPDSDKLIGLSELIAD